MLGASDPRACGRYADDLSAFADHTLPPRRWQQVGYHVAGCSRCRDEVAEIKRVCSTLSGTCGGRAATPESLTSRLEGIAGEHCDAPLYMAAGAPAELPSRRRDRLRLLTQSGAAAVSVLASLFVLAILISPEPGVVPNAVDRAREDYSLATTAINVNDALGAVLLAHQRGAQLSEPVHRRARATIVSHARHITHEQAAERLAGRTADVTFSGLQRVWVSDGHGAFHVSDVRVDEVAGEGASLEVLDERGDRFHSWFVPSSGCCSSLTPGAWHFFEFSGLDQVAGRWADVLEARDHEGRRVARWWLDTGNDMLLWSERYDTTGHPTLISGFLELTLDEAELDHDGTELVMLTASATPAGGPQDWCVGLDHCPDSLAGLPLVAHASSTVGDRTTMRLVYSDGLRALSVGWTEGVLPSGETLRVVDNVAGLPEVAVWQAGPGVVSVATNGGLGLLHEASTGLPAEEPLERSLMDRVRGGLARLGGFN